MLTLPPAPPYADIAPALSAVACSGETVTTVEIHRYAPSPNNAAERAMIATSEAVRLEFDATEEPIILAYVLLKPGSVCTETARQDSERLLRAQRFVSSAAVTALPDGAGHVRIRVDVVNEFSWVLGGRLGGGGVSAAHLGTIDLQGRGLTAVVSGERGGSYRPGFGLLVAHYGAFGRPAAASFELARRPLGGLLRVSVAEPYQTEGQRYALDASFEQETEYATLVRPGADDAAAKMRRTAYHAGVVKRVGVYRRDRVIGLAGLALIGVDTRSSEDVVVVSDEGLVATADSALTARYPAFALSRIAAVGGVRSLSFVTVRRFDALRAAQDVGRGLQASLLVSPSLWEARSVGDVLFVSDIYAGTGSAESFAAVRVRLEGRSRLRSGAHWRGVVGSARVSWHQIVSDHDSRLLSLSAATVQRMPFPVQLTLRDPDGGLVGFPDSHGAGGHRAALRVEQRRLLDRLGPRFDLALAAFADAGRLWAGDAPYGRNTIVRSSVGLSLMGSYPSGGKRLYRVDFALPVNPERGGARFAIRLSVADRTGATWLEPRDVVHARAGPGPASLTRW